MEYKSLSKWKNWKCLWRDKLHWQRQCTLFTAEISKCLREMNDHGCPKGIKSNNYFSPASVTIPLEYLDATFPENYLFKPYHSIPAKPDPKNIAKVSSNLGSTLWSWCSSKLPQVQITSPAHTYTICRAIPCALRFPKMLAFCITHYSKLGTTDCYDAWLVGKDP